MEQSPVLFLKYEMIGFEQRKSYFNLRFAERNSVDWVWKETRADVLPGDDVLHGQGSSRIACRRFDSGFVTREMTQLKRPTRTAGHATDQYGNLEIEK